ncbi:MAG: CPBP family intramembrane glutamic endopeptidase [Kiritimatiellia bacterium]|nr:CPBP family intramembrane glutamic endopeptidase [Kiritimatiellia bacterium]
MTFSSVLALAAPAERMPAVGWVYAALVFAGILVSVIVLIRAQRLTSVPAPQPLPPSPLSPRAAAALLALLFVLHALQAVLLPWIAPNGVDSALGGFLLVVQSLLFHGVAIGFVAVAIVRARRNPFEALGITPSRWVRNAGLGLVFYLIALPHVVLYGMISQWLLSRFGVEGDLQPVMQWLSAEQPTWLRFYLIGLGVIVAPIVEEILFRGIALPLLVRRMGVAPAVVTVSMVFAVIHFHVPSLVPLFLIGAAFSLAYLRTRDLTVPILMHAVFNLVNIGLMLYLEGTP